ncbi:hypothetical protein HYZ64_01480 [Candidatus Berkelbacteria bacterium]|nr:hypothetical protein [Candidatus Berkelbacteria bacterium]
MRYLKLFLSVVFVGILIWAGLIFAADFIRQDTITGTFGLNQEFCVGGDRTAHYINGRYVTFPETEPNRSFLVDSSHFEANPPFLGCNNLNNQTYVLPSELPAGNPTIVCLYSSNPLPTYDCRDTTPPTQSNITASSITQTGATITWTTNESATNTIKYGPVSGSYESYPTTNTKSAGTGTSASGAL